MSFTFQVNDRANSAGSDQTHYLQTLSPGFDRTVRDSFRRSERDLVLSPDLTAGVQGISKSVLNAFGISIPLDSVVLLQRKGAPESAYFPAQVIDAAEEGLFYLPIGSGDPSTGAKVLPREALGEIIIPSNPEWSRTAMPGEKVELVFPNGQPGMVAPVGATCLYAGREIPRDRTVTIHTRSGSKIDGRVVFYTRSDDLLVRPVKDTFEGPCQMIPRQEICGLQFSFNRYRDPQQWTPRTFLPHSENANGREIAEVSWRPALDSVSSYDRIAWRTFYPAEPKAPVLGISSGYLHAFGLHLPVERPVKLHMKPESGYADCIGQLIDATGDGFLVYLPLPQQAEVDAMVWEMLNGVQQGHEREALVRNGAWLVHSSAVAGFSFVPDPDIIPPSGQTVIFPTWESQICKPEQEGSVRIGSVDIPLRRQLTITLTDGAVVGGYGVHYTQTNQLILRPVRDSHNGGCLLIPFGAIEAVTYSA